MKPERAMVGRAPLIPRRLSREERARVRALLDSPSRQTCWRALAIEVAPGLRLWRALELANPTWRHDRKRGGGDAGRRRERGRQECQPWTNKPRVRYALGAMPELLPLLDRRSFLGALAGGLLAAPLAAEAQAGKVYRIGYLSPDSGPSLYSEAFRQGLRDLGWIEGRNILIEYRWAGERRERLLDLAAQLVQMEMDVILAATTPGALAAKSKTKMIPIVIPVANEAVATGLVQSLSRPGGNVTGFSVLARDITAKRLELLKEVAPGITRVAALVNPTHPGLVVELREGQDAVRALGIKLHVFEVRDRADLERAFSALIRQGTDGVVVFFDRLFVTQVRVIADLAAQHRVPTIHFVREFAEAGGLLAYGANIPDLYRRAATYVDKILKGAKPADLPVEQPTKFDLVMNLKTAKALGLTIPQSLLLRADQVIE